MLNKPLDREKTEFYKLRIEISDGKHVRKVCFKLLSVYPRISPLVSTGCDSNYQ